MKAKIIIIGTIEAEILVEKTEEKMDYRVYYKASMGEGSVDVERLIEMGDIKPEIKKWLKTIYPQWFL